MDSCVRGFHVYQDIWTPTTGECLSCQTEDSNAFGKEGDVYTDNYMKIILAKFKFGG